MFFATDQLTRITTPSRCPTLLSLEEPCTRVAKDSLANAAEREIRNPAADSRGPQLVIRVQVRGAGGSDPSGRDTAQAHPYGACRPSPMRRRDAVPRGRPPLGNVVVGVPDAVVVRASLAGAAGRGSYRPMPTYVTPAKRHRPGEVMTAALAQGPSSPTRSRGARRRAEQSSRQRRRRETAPYGCTGAGASPK